MNLVFSMKKFSPLLLVLAFAASPLQALEAPQVFEHQLGNGMKIFVKPDRRAPIAVTQVWYKVGASYEPDGITGISHALEHMMFKGTQKYGPNRFSELIAEQGGSENAFTGQDYTAYFQTLAADRLEIAFELEADRMKNLTLDAGEFAKEIKVVQEERRLRTEDKPKSLTYERFQATAWRVSPYRNPTIGWMSDLENMTTEDLRAWYQQWYAPNNATLVVVGDVEPKAIFAMAEKYFGPLEPSTISPQKPMPEPPQNGHIRMTVKAPAQQPYLLMGYKTPVITRDSNDWEPYALEMLVAVLDGGSSARLSRELIRGQEIAVSTGSNYDSTSRLPGMLTLAAVPAKNHSIAELEAALQKQVQHLKDELVSEQEMEKVRNQLLASKVYERDSVFYQAMLIGQLETVGLPWQLAETSLEKMRQVTAEQVREVARKYLTQDNLTFAELVPQPMDKEKTFATRPTAGGRHDF